VLGVSRSSRAIEAPPTPMKNALSENAASLTVNGRARMEARERHPEPRP